MLLAIAYSLICAVSDYTITQIMGSSLIWVKFLHKIYQRNKKGGDFVAPASVPTANITGD